MNWRNTGILFVVFAGLVGYLLWQNQQGETAVPTPETAETIPPTPVRTSLIATTNDAVQGINIIDLNSDDEVLYVQSTPSDWLQITPEESEVISGTLNTAVSGILNLTSTRTLSGDENPLSAFGLDTPAHRINIAIGNVEADQTIRVSLFIGDITPVGNSYYVQKEGDSRVHIVPSGLIDNLIALLTDPPLVDASDTTSE